MTEQKEAIGQITSEHKWYIGKRCLKSTAHQTSLASYRKGMAKPKDH